MEVKSVPWWRKALDFALSGIRSGFGLFSKTQKQKDITEPETVAGHEEIREEEAALTEHLPKQDSTVEAMSQVVAVVEPEGAPDAEVAPEPEVTAQDAPEAEMQPEKELVSGPEIQMQPEEKAAPDTECVDEALKDEPLPEGAAAAEAGTPV